MSDLSALEAEVTANTEVGESVKVLVGRLADEIAAAGTDQGKLDALVATLRSNDTSLADMVVANTPVADPDPVEPPVDPPVEPPVDEEPASVDPT